MSEFYKLRRTVIKDVTAFCGFLIGLLGSTPIAWRYLAVQLEANGLVRGLWYFFAVITVAAVLAGIVGLAAGHIMGRLWERYHRHRRGLGGSRGAEPSAAAAVTAPVPGTESTSRHGDGGSIDLCAEPVRLRLVGAASSPFSPLVNSRLTSVRFSSSGVELDFNGMIVAVSSNPAVVRAGERLGYPDAGSRDALCRLIGGTVNSVNSTAGSEVELSLDNGCQLVFEREAVDARSNRASVSRIDLPRSQRT